MTISTLPQDHNLPLSTMRHEPRFQVESKSDDFDFSSVLRIVRRRIVMIAVLTMSSMLVALVMIWDLKPSYRAESRLIIHKPLTTTLSAEEAGRNEPLELRSETERLLSRGVAERVIHDLHLEKRPEFNPALRDVSLIEKFRQMLRGLVDSGKLPPPEPSSVDRILPEYYRALRVWRDGLGDVIQIGFDATDPELAAAAPNRLIDIYLEERNQSIRRRLDTAEEWIRQRVEEQQGRANAARLSADTYREAMGVLPVEEDPSERLKPTLELSDRQGKIAQSRAEIMGVIAALETAKDASLALYNVPVPENVGAMLQDLRTQQRDLGRLLETYGDNAQAVIDLRAIIVNSKFDLGVASDRYLQTLHVKLAALNEEYEAIRSELKVAEEKRSRAASAEAELARRERIVDREQAALDKLEEQRRGLAGQAMLPGTEVEVLSPAAVPIGPQGRGRLFYLIGALLASTSVSITIAFMFELLDKRVRSFDQLAGMARIISAGFIPHLKKKGWRRWLMPFVDADDNRFDDAIRDVVTSLRQSNGGKLPNSVLVTSARDGDGKSFVARSLAFELVSSGQPVLLVEGDLQGGGLERFFKSGLRNGLSAYLSGRAELREIIHHHNSSGIDFIPAGSARFHRRIRSEGFAEIIELARARGQVAIFDSAGASRSSDAIYLAAMTERTLMVVGWGKTSRRVIESSLRRLRGKRNAEVLIAINNANIRRHGLYGFNDRDLFSSPAV